MPISYRELMLATPAPAPFNRPGWLFELKYDGFRTLAMNAGQEPRIISRNGIEMTALFPEIATELKTLPEIVLDGELVVLDKQGHPVFELLRRRSAMKIPKVIAHAAKTMPAAFFAFDLLSLGGKDLRALPLIERKRQLREVLRGRPIRRADARNQKRICYLQHVETDGTQLYTLIENAGLEGIVAKQADAPYRAGRTSAWLKVKTPAGRMRESTRLDG